MKKLILLLAVCLFTSLGCSPTLTGSANGIVESITYTPRGHKSSDKHTVILNQDGRRVVFLCDNEESMYFWQNAKIGEEVTVKFENWPSGNYIVGEE